MAELKDIGRTATSSLKHGVHDAQQAASQATSHAAPWLEALARFGYASKGAVYGTVGFLALSVALGRGGATTDTQGALLRLQDLPAGPLLMWLLTLGLIGYALWQLIRAAFDPEGQGHQAKGVIKRSGYALSGAANVGLALFTARLATLGTATRQQNSEDRVASTILDLPGGQLLLALGGLALLAVAANQLYSAYGAKFMKRMAFTDVSGRPRDALVRIGQVGITSRGILMVIIGVFALLAAWHRNATETVGISEALTWLRTQPAGNLLLGAVALGTLCYGVWCVVQARYRRIRIEDSAAG
ncbi:DUF1206 domain-containing protein [Deinococcus taeanensis]|uniref:DUF1206 domain-containing protein n=1 Tax=Deinococcus taeanensis TaxID=2737050 RepID=UPI001CDB77D0|nr:DUF1206 domain-containing protein [Deinococcus taeanensis]UBV42183.1 DUF1206 domain-containing protein [Deinococcus taeanensis]